MTHPTRQFFTSKSNQNEKIHSTNNRNHFVGISNLHSGQLVQFLVINLKIKYMLQKTQTIKKPLTRSVTVRFSHELFNHYENESKKLGVKFSELIRQKLQKKTKQST